MTDILAVDLATMTGWARGCVGDEAPTFGTARFYSPDQNETFALGLQWITDMVRENPPQMLMLEAMLPPGAMTNKTSRQVRDRLAGLHGVIRASAKRWGVAEISTASVGNVRRHFIGRGDLKRVPAKQEVVTRCRMLGWDVANDNEGDACAIWSFAVSLIDPKQGLRVSPLFNKKLRITG